MIGAAMPKAPIDENGDAVPTKDDVGPDDNLAGVDFSTASKAEPSPMQGGTERELGASIAP